MSTTLLSARRADTVNVQGTGVLRMDTIQNGAGKPQYAFGEFLFMPDSGELHEGGKLIQLRPQVAKLLELLLRNANALVTRDDIRHCLWGDKTVVEFEEGISACMRQLRVALNDGVSGTRYIQTISRRGYRFIFPVSVVSGAPAPAGNGGAMPVALPATAVARRRGRWPVLGVALVGVAVIVALLVYFEAGALRARKTPAAPPQFTIAVLPFANLSSNQKNTILGASIANDLIDLLGPIAPDRLNLIADTSTTHYASSNQTIKQIGAELGAAYVLEGSIMPLAHGVQVSARLIRASDQRYVWGDEYTLAEDYPNSDYQQMLVRIASQVAGLLAPDAEVQPLAYTANRAAAADFELGRYLFSQGEFTKSDAYCRKASGLDPNFAAAYLCSAEALLAPRNLSDAQVQTARHLISRGLQLDPHSAEAHLLQGRIAMFFDWNPSTAGGELKQALRLKPGDARILQAYAAYLSANGQNREMQQTMELAQGLDPVSASVSSDYALFLFIARQYDQAEQHAGLSLSLNPADDVARHLVVLGLLGEGHYAAAAQAAAEEMQYRQATAADIARMRSGNQAALVNYFRWYAQTLAGAPPDKLTAVFLADAYMHLGQQDQALAVLESTVRQRAVSTLIPFISVWPSLHPLCRNPAFASMTRQLGQPGCAVAKQ